MAGIKISALPAVPSAALTDIFPVVQGGVTSQESLTQVLALFQGKITSLGAQTQALNMNTHLINGVVDPVSAQDAATKNYVDTLITGGGAAVVAATTGALTVTQSGAGVGATLTNAGAQAAFQIDGVSPTSGQRVLIKNQVTTSQNGVYTVTTVGSGATNWVLTRATDYNTPADINSTGVIPVVSGTVNANTGWINTTLMVTVDTTAITFVQFGASYPISLANGGTNASLTAANGAIPYSTASAFAFLAPGSSGQLFQSGGAGAPSWTSTPALGTPASGVLTNTTAGGGLRSFQVLTSGTAATYTKPANVTSILVECVGGGGGAGGSASTAGQGGAGGGGGGGGYCRKYFASAAATYTYTVGAGGAGGATGNNNGAVGGNTTFSSMTATGGGLGTGSATTANPAIRVPAIAGGIPTGGDINIQGGASTPSYTNGTAGVGMVIGGVGGSSFYGPGAGGAADNALQNGNNAPTNSGGGGSGGVSNNGAGTAAGGSGGSGLIIVWELS